MGENGLKELETVCWVLDICNAKVNDSCGFHVHMDAAGFNLDTWKNLTLTYKHLEHLIDAFMPRTRRNNTYCKTLSGVSDLSLIHISEPTRQAEISYAVFCLKKKKTKNKPKTCSLVKSK